MSPFNGLTITGATKIVDETETRRWHEEGRTYAWIVADRHRARRLRSLRGNFAIFFVTSSR